ncbi:MAG: hypothetical protein AVDCRST_MAG03-2561, partial [uncultured Rubrobacteraceae bacterium]
AEVCVEERRDRRHRFRGDRHRRVRIRRWCRRVALLSAVPHADALRAVSRREVGRGRWRRRRGQEGSHGRRSGAREILDARYAGGEI